MMILDKPGKAEETVMSSLCLCFWICSEKAEETAMICISSFFFGKKRRHMSCGTGALNQSRAGGGRDSHTRSPRVFWRRTQHIDIAESDFEMIQRRRKPQS